MLLTAKEIIDLGISDPELFGLLSFLEEGIGADTVSDMTANAIMPALAKLTQEFSKEHGVPLGNTRVADAPCLPLNPYDTRRSGIVLVPLDILRDLPMANTRDDVSRVCAQNEEIRTRVSAMLGEIAKATVRERKRALKEYALDDARNFNKVLNTVLNLGDEAYDADFDPQGHLVLRQALTVVAAQFPLKLETKEKTRDALQTIVQAIVDHFKQLVEKTIFTNYSGLPKNPEKNERRKSCSMESPMPTAKRTTSTSVPRQTKAEAQSISNFLVGMTVGSWSR